MLTTPLIPDDELLQRYVQLFTGAVNDVLRGRGLVDQTLPHDIRPLRDEMKLAGFAFTVAGEKDRGGVNDMPERAAMLESIRPGAVCVWDTGRDDESAQWGEVMTMAARRQGCRGAVIDGGVRDTDRVLSQDFPVFSRYRSSSGMLGRFRITGWQHSISIGGVVIEPGDLLFGDIDGVIVVPAELAVPVLLEAERIKHDEVGIKQLIEDGSTPRDVVDRGGYF
ncbi:dimethylmenaquinone methyltransferase [Jiangella anatolica]|uniref:Putative 4-hydroxy-4-methyl-2-oxoglutarate aldolase n=1 Tax=Jiangella anatolica TaxID=2670374 RepID=A0A2W2BK08_9ACTN|nr:dimethylmenaquinone methyltransferase [Jiangella anatolica]